MHIVGCEHSQTLANKKRHIHTQTREGESETEVIGGEKKHTDGVVRSLV